MTMQPRELRTRLKPGGSGVLRARGAVVPLASLVTGNPLSAEPEALAGAHVLLKTRDQLSAGLALIALDGVASRIVIAPPDVKPDHLESVIERAQIDTLVTDGEPAANLKSVTVSKTLRPLQSTPPVRASEWVMFTSGTTGVPKMVAHSLEALTGAIKSAGEGVTWGTFYDIRRYGGLQIFLRALLGDASLILSDTDENIAEFLTRLGRDGITHLTGTPSHWRRALMSPAIGQVHPRYVRLSGEIADQAVLDSLKARFPDAAMGHAYASTEAGVGFEVTDGLEGFPASFVGGTGPVEMRVIDGTLQIRSSRTASRFIGSAETLVDDGFVDTGDMVERKGDRYYFAGRRGGIINVGGLKIHPEEVEAVINRHPAVRLSRVLGRKSPITGAIVVAEVVLDGDRDRAVIQEEILQNCRTHLKPFQVPAMVRFVPKLELSAGESCCAMRNVLVTGGSRGLGLAIARKLVADGFRVLALARKATEDLNAAIAAAPAGALHFVAFDLAQTGAIADLVKGLKTAHGPIYGLVNNAGLGTEGVLTNMPEAKIEALIQLNILAPVLLTKAVMRSMMVTGEGRIVNMASIIGFTGYSGLSVYGATKASMLGFTRSLAREAGRLGGVTVNAVAPGFVDTEMTASLTDEQRQRIASRSALKRLADPDDVAGAVSYLMSDAARNITGTTITVDAGNTA